LKQKLTSANFGVEKHYRTPYRTRSYLLGGATPENTGARAGRMSPRIPWRIAARKRCCT